MADLIGTFVGLTLTLAILSYLLGDNPLYRLATHVFIGATAGYVTLIVYFTAFQPLVVQPLLAVAAGQPMVGLFAPVVGLALSALLLLRFTRGGSALGNVAVAYLVGVGAAVAVGGAITGTLFPQIAATFLDLRAPFAQPDLLATLEKLVEYLFVIFGTLATLAFFYYGARRLPGNKVARPVWLQPVALAGQIILGVTFGVVYAGAILAGLAFLTSHLVSLTSLLP